MEAESRAGNRERVVGEESFVFMGKSPRTAQSTSVERRGAVR